MISRYYPAMTTPEQYNTDTESPAQNLIAFLRVYFKGNHEMISQLDDGTFFHPIDTVTKIEDEIAPNLLAFLDNWGDESN